MYVFFVKVDENVYKLNVINNIFIVINLSFYNCLSVSFKKCKNLFKKIVDIKFLLGTMEDVGNMKKTST